MRIRFRLLLLLLFALRLGAQSDRLLLPMDDGQTIRLNLFSARGSDIVQARYLPFNLRLAGPPGARAFSFQAYRESDDGPLAGATMHLLLTWGATPEQRQEIEQLLQVRRDTFHRFVGSVGVDAIPITDLPLITPSDDPLARLLRDNLVSSGSPPTDTGGKMALAFKFNAPDARRMEELLRSPDAWHKTYFQLGYRLFPNRGGPPIVISTSFASCLISLRK